MRVLSGLIRLQSENLYVEEVDVGESKPRSVISGLAKHLPLSALENARVCVVINLQVWPVLIAFWFFG